MGKLVAIYEINGRCLWETQDWVVSFIVKTVKNDVLMGMKNITRHALNTHGNNSDDYNVFQIPKKLFSGSPVIMVTRAKSKIRQA